jgi:predicted transcriptional regulator
MQNQMPQEIEVWYIIPALRREVAKCMIELGLSQKLTAEKMEITEAAVSQYLSSKRAKEVIFSNAILEEVRKSTKIIIEDSNRLVQEMLRLSNLTGVKQVMCDLHKKQDTNLPGSCNICFEGDLVNVIKGEK